MPKINKLAAKLKGKKLPGTEPLWKGPCAEGPLGGITQSMIGNWLCDRERFRIKYVEGLRTMETFNHRLEYGQLWHTCEEALAKGVEWPTALERYAQSLLVRYPTQQQEVEKWYMACRMQFPVYVQYWAKHPDVVNRTPLMQEEVFDVPYQLPSGKVVRLRGKFDSVDLIGKGKDAGVYLQENKTKGDADEQEIKRQLKWDLQTMMYLIALSSPQKTWHSGAGRDVPGWKYGTPIKGVRYNVIRRPLSGGKGSIKQKEATTGSKCPKCKGVKIVGMGMNCPKCDGVGRINCQPAETAEEYWDRLQQYFLQEPEAFFMRWTSEVSPEEIKSFERRCLQPILEEICAWYKFVTTGDPFRTEANFGIHYMFPLGVTNMLLESGANEYDVYLETGSRAGLKRRDSLFQELQ